MRKISAEVILSVIAAPIFFWFLSFVLSSYQTQADVQDTKNDIQEIKEDVKYIKNYLMENRNGGI